MPRVSDAPDAPSSATELLEQLRAEHALLESRIESYNQRLYLSAREQLERKRLQKLKLLTKDRIRSFESPSSEE
jgi:hypothetical protein